jgi:hypothetical protein
VMSAGRVLGNDRCCSHCQTPSTRFFSTTGLPGKYQGYTFFSWSIRFNQGQAVITSL